MRNQEFLYFKQFLCDVTRSYTPSLGERREKPGWLGSGSRPASWPRWLPVREQRGGTSPMTSLSQNSMKTESRDALCLNLGTGRKLMLNQGRIDSTLSEREQQARHATRHDVTSLLDSGQLWPPNVNESHVAQMEQLLSKQIVSRTKYPGFFFFFTSHSANSRDDPDAASFM